MKRHLIILLSIVAVSTVGIVIGASSNTNNNSVSASLVPPTAAQQNPSGVIDGAVTPELIPDQVAYTLMFRLLSDRHTEEERNSARSYLRMALGCTGCNDQANSAERRAADEALIDAALAVVDRFERRVGALDRQAEQIHALNPNPSFADLAQLNALQAQKEALIAELIASLPRQMGAEGAERMRRHVNERVKRRARITPEHVHN